MPDDQKAGTVKMASPPGDKTQNLARTLHKNGCRLIQADFATPGATSQGRGETPEAGETPARFRQRPESTGGDSNNDNPAGAGIVRR